MLYGIILDSARDGVILSYGLNVWKRIVYELKLPSETFDLFTHYSDNIMLNICDCKYLDIDFSIVIFIWYLLWIGLVDILHEGIRDTYLKFFGQDFFRYFKNCGYDKLFRVAGRTLREFLFVIDQLHDSNRFTFPQMQNPLFHITEEDHAGTTLEYK
jgi:guanylate cyclase